MKHGYGCGCPDCEEAHPNAFDHVGEPKPTPMTRERLSEEEIGRISRSTPIPETLSVVEDILTARVTAARLAATGAAEAAAIMQVAERLRDVETPFRLDEKNNRVYLSAKETCHAIADEIIRSRMTPGHVSALDKKGNA